MITIALPKGRLYDKTASLLAQCGYQLTLSDRQLVAEEPRGRIRAILVKNADLPTYVHHGIAGLGVCGTDVIHESGYAFQDLLDFPFGKTKICLAGLADGTDGGTGKEIPAETETVLRVATKFPRFTREFFHRRGIAVSVIKLNGSVELAPVLGLAPYIVDLVETGSTLRAHNLVVRETLGETRVKLVANRAFFKYYYRSVGELVGQIRQQLEADAS